MLMYAHQEIETPVGIQSVLERIFPEENIVYECILTLMRMDREPYSGTCDKANISSGKCVPNTSVVGMYRNGSQLTMKLYRGSDSFTFINDNGVVSLSIPKREKAMDIFIRAALHGYGNEEQEFPKDWYSYLDNPGNSGKVPIPGSCSVNIICVPEKISEKPLHDDLGETLVKDVLLDVSSIINTGPISVAFTREQHPILEALVHATRCIASGDKDSLSRVEKHLSIAERNGGTGTRKRVELIRDVLYSSSSSRKE